VAERLRAYVCPICGRQYRGPGGHHVAGDDMATSCFHGGVVQPKLKCIVAVPREQVDELVRAARDHERSLPNSYSFEHRDRLRAALKPFPDPEPEGEADA
jgi:hypothetical protein